MSKLKKETNTGVNRVPLKRVEIPLYKFNDVAIPHHVDLLMKHKSNIEKFQNAAEWDKVHHEQVNATRLIKQLKNLLSEMDVLRNQVQNCDVSKFDKLTESSRQNAVDAIQEYLDMNPQRLSPVWFSTQTNVRIKNDHDSDVQDGINLIDNQQNLHLTTSISSEDLERQEACLRSWENLQMEAQDVRELFQDFTSIIQDQKESIDNVEKNVDVSAENVMAGTAHLGRAVKYKAALYPMAGAVLGGCLGGPIGLIAGMKLGGLAAIGGGVLGFTGGKFLKKRREDEESKSDVELHNLIESSCSAKMKGSLSLPLISSPSVSAKPSSDMVFSQDM